MGANGYREVAKWLRGVDLNHRPLGYEPNELPDCSTPRHSQLKGCDYRQGTILASRTLQNLHPTSDIPPKLNFRPPAASKWTWRRPSLWSRPQSRPSPATSSATSPFAIS